MGIKVLVVDDAEFVRNKLKMILKNTEFEVVGEAENAIEAVDEFEFRKPEIVTLDITMPFGNGLEVLEKIKRIDINSKVVMISAMGQDKNVLKALKLGAENFIVKPFTPDKVLSVLREVIKKR